MRIFFDTEFIEHGSDHPIIPISIGLVREDGKIYYAEFEGVDWSSANTWVLENVKPYLRGPVKSKVTIAQEVKKFVGKHPEFWAYFADYDWVLLCQLYGTMLNLPETWPMFCLDIKQYMYHLDLTKEDIQGIENEREHDALADAQWNAEVFSWLLNYTQARMLEQ